MAPLLNGLETTLLVLGTVVLVFGLVKLLYVPLALWFELRAARRGDRPSLLDDEPLVSIVVPAYNEAIVVAQCVDSILAAEYARKEVILVDDGSTDSTAEVMASYALRHAQVRAVRQVNAGKGAALNTGAELARGDVLIFVDADSIFLPDTIESMLRGFDDDKVGAVCGDDRPVNLNTVQTRLLTVISHLGTGLVRRALTVLRCMPIVSGNSGAFRRDVFVEVGRFDTDTVGEDMELTWRVHRAGYQVRFAPRALVYAESPSTIGGLWKQRVRWGRGLLQATWKHRAMIGNLRYGTFGPFLAFNTMTMIVIPVLQLIVLLLLPVILALGGNPLPATTWQALAWLGLIVTVVLALIAIGLNRAWRDLRHLWTLPLWPIYSVFVTLTLVRAVYLQLARRPAQWNKLDRTGVVSVVRPAPTPVYEAEAS